MNNNGFPGFTATWIVPAALILLGIVIIALIVLAIEENRRRPRPRPARKPGRHEHPARPARVTTGARVQAAVRGLPSDRSRRAALSALAEPCTACGTDHIGDCVAGALPAHLRPGVVLPATPKASPALEPLPLRDSVTETAGLPEQAVRAIQRAQPWTLPEMTGEELAEIKSRFHAALKEKRPVAWLPPEPTLTITAGPGADEAYQDVVNAGLHDAKTKPHVGQGTDKSGTAQRATGSLSGSESAKAQQPPAAHPNRPGLDGQTTGEIFEHVHEGERCWCLPWKPAPLPQAVVKDLGHTTVDDALASIVARSEEEAERFRAELEARLAQDDAARANGQVSSDA